MKNVLSFFVVAHKFNITIDTDSDLSINVHLYGGTIIMRKKCSRGLYYYDTTNMENIIIFFLLTGIYVLKICT